MTPQSRNSASSSLRDDMDRRRFMRGSSAFAGLAAMGLAGCSKHVKSAAMPSAPGFPFYDMPGKIVPLRAEEDRVFRVTVCLRPFRAAGPRLEVEKTGDKAIVHNYGHGGSGWSLSWGYALRVARMVSDMSPSSREAAVVGAGALGLTSAIQLQRAGFKVTIYARDLAPYTRSSRATGTWTPDSRIALADKAPANFGDEWEKTARSSFFYYQSFLGTPGSPVEWIDTYNLSDPSQPRQPSPLDPQDRPEEHKWLHLEERIADLVPKEREMPQEIRPFPTERVTQSSTLMFNVADYSRQLLNDFFTAGGKFERREFHTPQEIASLPQGVIVNCPGYEARKLWSDSTITPVRGQISWLIPQEGNQYGFRYKHLNVVSRRDGVVLQMSANEDYGWGDEDETPRAAETKYAISILKDLYGRMDVSNKKA